MVDIRRKDKLNAEGSCDCSDPGCCQPKPRSLWKKIAFYAVIILAMGIIAFKLFSSPSCDSACNSKDCCSDTTKCIEKK